MRYVLWNETLLILVRIFFFYLAFPPQRSEVRKIASHWGVVEMSRVAPASFCRLHVCRSNSSKLRLIQLKDGSPSHCINLLFLWEYNLIWTGFTSAVRNGAGLVDSGELSCYITLRENTKYCPWKQTKLKWSPGVRSALSSSFFLSKS